MSEPTGLHQRIINILKSNPEGISINKIRLALSLSAEDQQHLDRRLRDLDKRYNIVRRRSGREVLYLLVGDREQRITERVVDKTTRARILHRDGYRCQACGRTPKDDSVKLHIDHKIPREWGGKQKMIIYGRFAPSITRAKRITSRALLSQRSAVPCFTRVFMSD